MVEHKLVEGDSPVPAPTRAQGGDDVRSLWEGTGYDKNLLKGIGVVDTVQHKDGSTRQPKGGQGGSR